MGGAISMQSDGAKRGELADQSVRDLVLGEYDRHQIALRRYVAYLGLDVDSAHDVVHESFLKLHQHLTEGGERVNLRAWLYRVVHNLARNRQNRAEANHSALDELIGVAEPPARERTPEDQMLLDERERRLREAVRNLPEGQRECLVLRAQGLKYREIGQVVGLSVSTVGEHIQRGLDALKGCL
jgi:RNA polymerase sigma-70 factor (ECF subfamily)